VYRHRNGIWDGWVAQDVVAAADALYVSALTDKYLDELLACDGWGLAHAA
jgi:hypothetical protein